MKKVLVTGGAGFIGSHLVDLLLKKDFEVDVIDNYTNNCVTYDDHKVRHIGHNIIDFVYQEDSYESVFHLASIVGPVGVLKHSGNIGYSIISDIVKLRDYCCLKGMPLIHVSSSEIYGHSDDLSEEAIKIFPAQYKSRTEYGAAKMLSEIALVNFRNKNKNFKYQIIRPFNVAGARQQPEGGFVLPRFVIATLTNQSLTVYGTGEQRRSFTDVRDVAEAIYLTSQTDLYNNIWNVGNRNNEMSILELAKFVVRVAKEKYGIENCEIVHVDPNELHGELFSEVPDKLPNAEKIISKLNWKPQYSIYDTITSAFDYWLAKLNKGYMFKVL